MASLNGKFLSFSHLQGAIEGGEQGVVLIAGNFRDVTREESFFNFLGVAHPELNPQITSEVLSDAAVFPNSEALIDAFIEFCRMHEALSEVRISCMAAATANTSMVSCVASSFNLGEDARIFWGYGAVCTYEKMREILRGSTLTQRQYFVLGNGFLGEGSLTLMRGEFDPLSDVVSANGMIIFQTTGIGQKNVIMVV